MAAIFTYGFAVSEENFKNANIDFLEQLSKLNLLFAKRYISEEEANFRNGMKVLLLGPLKFKQSN
jgi:DNA replication protein DnaC